MKVNADDFKKLIIKFKDMRQKILIIGHPETIKSVEDCINDYKDEFSDYKFSFESNELFEKDQIYLLAEEDVNKNKLLKTFEYALDYESRYSLPSIDEYKNSLISYQMEQYSEPKFKCPKCGGGMRMDNTCVLTTYPPKHRYVCDKCGHSVAL